MHQDKSINFKGVDMQNIQLRLEVEALLNQYVATIDDDKLEEWPDFSLMNVYIK